MSTHSNCRVAAACILLILHAGNWANGQIPATIPANHSRGPVLAAPPDRLCIDSPIQSSSPRGRTGRARQLLETEWKMGSSLARDVEKHTLIVHDAATTTYLNDIERRLVRASSLDGCFFVQVIIDPEPNASSLPGGFIYLTTGLVQTAENEDELAAALAHETAHVIARHFTRIEKRRERWGRIAFAGGPLGLVLRYWAGPFLTMKVVRDYELDADQRALRYYISAGYEADFSAILESVSPEDDTKLSFSERLLDSHPPTPERIKLIHRARRSLSRPNLTVKTDPDAFLMMKVHFATLDLTPHFECDSSRELCSPGQ